MSIKLFIFDSVEQARAFNTSEPTVRPQPNADDVSNGEEEPLHHRKKGKAKPARGDKPVRHCKKCGEPGHRSDNCPESKRPAERTDEELSEAIKGLREEGLDALHIAARLKLPLKKVKEFI